MSEGQNETGGGLTGATQDLGNQGVDSAQKAVGTLVDAAQSVLNEAYDFAEEGAADVLGGLLTANRLVGDALEKAIAGLTGKTPGA